MPSDLDARVLVFPILPFLTYHFRADAEPTCPEEMS